MATIFKQYPVVDYNGQYQMDITVRPDIVEHYKNNERYYFTYNISDSETAEILSDKLYDTPDYAWIILSFNNIVNPFEQWPKSSAELNSYILEKYERPYDVVYYMHIDTGLLVDSTLYSRDKLVPITNYEYEQIVNDKKRKIKLPLPEIATIIASEAKKQFN